MSNRKLCFVTPTLKMGGMERVLVLIANHAVEQGFKVSIICLIEKVIAYPLDERVEVYGPNAPYKKGLINKLRTLKFLRKMLKSINPETTLCFSEAFNPIAIMASILAGLPIYISDRSNPYKRLSKSKELFRRATYPFAKGMIAQTELAKDVAIKKGFNNNIIISPNPLRKIDDTYPKQYRKRIVTVGRLVASKNIQQLITIFSEINKKDWELYILGDGDEMKPLQDLIDKLKSGDQIKLVGAVKDVDYHFSQASIFAFTSVSEGFPNALSEAMAFPLASISYDCPAGPSDIIQNNENGFLIHLLDKVQFKEKLTHLMEDEFLRNRFTQNFDEHRKKFSSEKIISDILGFILSGK